MNPLFKIVILLLFLLALSSCVVLPTKDTQPVSVRDATIDTQVNPENQDDLVVETVPLMNNAVKSLYHQARDAYQKNNFVQAVASLERAHKIQADSPQVSQLLSEIYLHQGQYKQAHYWAGIATKNGPSKGRTCEKSWRILAIAAENLGYFAHQAKALEQKQTCLVKAPARY